MMDGRELLCLKGVTKSFGSAAVLKGLDLSVNKGEFITLLGPSGCGKTTSLRIIAGLEYADSGEIFLDGNNVTNLEPNKRNVNMVFQNYALFPHMNVEQNIGYSLKLKGLSKQEIKKTVLWALDLVQLSGFGRRRPDELSGGQRQRVAVARAVVNKPKVLLLDEPLGALDLQLRRQMQTELKRLQQQLGITFIYITHDQEEALTMSDRIAVMRNGIFEQIGSAVDIYEKPRTAFVARFVGNANIIEGTALVSEKRNAGYLITVEPAAGGGRISAMNGESVASGEKIRMAVRGEYIELSGADSSSESGIRGLDAVITGKSFAGGQLRITARLKDGAEISASRHGMDSSLAAGDKVFVTWKSGHAVILDSE
jgi:spermidine/putrescine transport system ATP-binding protein